MQMVYKYIYTYKRFKGCINDMISIRLQVFTPMQISSDSYNNNVYIHAQRIYMYSICNSVYIYC